MKIEKYDPNKQIPPVRLEWVEEGPRCWSLYVQDMDYPPDQRIVTAFHSPIDGRFYWTLWHPCDPICEVECSNSLSLDDILVDIEPLIKQHKLLERA